MQQSLAGYSLAFILLVGASLSSATEKVTLQLRWLHQFQFAGYYMALEKGYYKAAGIDVSLIPGGPHAAKPIDQVLSGEVDFAISSSGVVIERLEGKPVVALAAIMQKSPIVWITLKSSNLRTPHDLIGRRVLMMPPPESAELLTVILREGLSIDMINIQPSTYRIQDLIDGKTDAYDGYISNEPYYLAQKGIDYHIISPRDYGINFYGDVLVTNEKLAISNPDLVIMFTNASLKGWQYAFDHLEETVQFIHRQYVPNKPLAHLRYEAESIRSLVMPEVVQIGHMNPGRWEFIAKSYQDLKMTTGTNELTGFIFSPGGDPDYKLALQIGVGSAALLLLSASVIYRFNNLSKALRESNKKLTILATVDPLTGAKNRRGFFDRAKLALSQARRVNSKSSLLMLDLDHFKRVNDQYGHRAGDEALRQFTTILHAQCREHDIIGRVGGEEFAILLLNSDREDMILAAERIMQQIRRLHIKVPDSSKLFELTTSIGAAEICDSLDDAWQAADSALYHAKSTGRDRIEVAFEGIGST